MVSPLVSVIIPTYNRPDQVLEAIDSIRAQTHKHTEIILVDDGSTDDRVRAIGEHDDVTYVRHERQGPGAARTLGLGLATGEFIASLDSDDVWHADFLERSLEPMTAFGLDFVFANWVRAPGDPSWLDLREAEGRLARYRGDTHGDWSLLTPAQVRRMILDACPAPSSSMLLRRSSMPTSWNARMQVADDWYLLLEMTLKRPCRAAFTTRPLWLKRVDGANRYEGRAPGYVIRRLYLHDHLHFRRDFASRLSWRERTRWALRTARRRAELGYLRLRGKDAQAPPTTT
jgi:glycosyltransferase involved in cell wall biosynthesis